MPQSQIKENPELARQLACTHIFDLWIAHASDRRWAAVTDVDNEKHIYFFSHRNIFTPENPAASQMRASFAYEAACRISGKRKDINAFVRSLIMLTPGELRAAFETVPSFWRSASDEESALRFLHLRGQWFRWLCLKGFRMPDQNSSLAIHLCENDRSRRKHTMSVTS